MDGGAWQATVHGVATSRIQLSDFTFTFHFHALEKEMATHSSVLAWRIPGTGEPGGLSSMGLHRVGHDWSDIPAYQQSNHTFPWVSGVLSILNEEEKGQEGIDDKEMMPENGKFTDESAVRVTFWLRPGGWVWVSCVPPCS